jgi:hypothetical protein
MESAEHSEASLGGVPLRLRVLLVSPEEAIVWQ